MLRNLGPSKTHTQRVDSAKRDSAFDLSIYRFILFTFAAALMASIVHFVYILHFGASHLLRLDGTPFSIALIVLLIFALWTRPSWLRGVIFIGYVYVLLGVTFKLIYLFWNVTALTSELLVMVPWMSISFVLSFLIFNRRLAALLSCATVVVWITITALFIALHSSTPAARQLLLEMSQNYVAQAILIGFMTLFAHLRGMYLTSNKSALHMEEMAHTDFLLGTANRRGIHLELEEQLKEAQRTGLPLSIILMDVDKFKHINDEYGHDEGDAVLVGLTASVTAITDEAFFFGRWGGDEFLFVMPGSTVEDACRFANRIRGMVESHRFGFGRATASFGVAEWKPEDTIDSLLKRADEALYESKRGGRNRVESAM